MKQVSGILIDFFAAKDLQVRADPTELGVITSLRNNSRLHFCMDEEPLFAGDQEASGIFGNSQPNFVAFSEAFLERCEELSPMIPDHRFLGESRTPLHIAAYAKANNFGVLTLHRSIYYVTASECCALNGTHCWDCANFFPDFPEIQFV